MAGLTTAEAQLVVLDALVSAAGQERTWAIVAASSGALAVLLALACWLVWAKPVGVGAAIPLGVLGLIQGMAGVTHFVKASSELQTLPDLVREAPHQLETRLTPIAADEVLAGQVTQVVDGGLLVAGLVLVTRRERLRGIGLGLLVMGALSLALDSLALERHRAKVDVLTTTAAQLWGG
ncbi:MAG: hypothetical protein JNM69_13690 [Archangium sp.]|nr:hypothetical protein [Archangium sp.]